MIHLFGDSITAGVPGVPFCRYFEICKDYKIYGVGGDTVIGLSNRIDNIIFNEKDICVIEIGANDILLDKLRKTSTRWEKVIVKIEQSGRILTKDKAEFTDKYRELLHKLGHKNVLVISIPCIGEDIESDTNKKVDSYNAIIRELCTCTGEIYLDFNKWQKAEVKSYKSKERAFISNHPIGMIIDILLTKYFLLTNIISKRRNLCTTIDGVHLNSNGATALAEMIEEIIKGN